MIRRNGAIISGVMAAGIVFFAYFTQGPGRFQMLNAWILFPGGLPSLLVHGVHENWGLIGNIVLYVGSAAFWFVSIFVGASLFARGRRGSE